MPRSVYRGVLVTDGNEQHAPVLIKKRNIVLSLSVDDEGSPFLRKGTQIQNLFRSFKVT